MLVSPFYKLRLFVLIIGDISIVMLAYRLSFFLRNYFRFFIFTDVMPADVYQNLTHYSLLLVVIQIVTLYFFGLYDMGEHARIRSYIKNLVFSVIICCLILITIYYFLAEFDFPRSIFFVFGVINLLMLLLFRYFVIKVFSISLEPRIVAILGTNKTAKDILRHLVKDKKTFHIKGFVSREPAEEKSFMDFPILGNAGELPDIIRKHRIDEVVVAQTNSWLDDIVHHMSTSDQKTRITIVPSAYEILIGKLKQVKIHDIPLIEIYKDPVPSSLVFVKRLFDLCLSLVSIIVLFPLFLLIGALVKLTSSGPVFYKQERYGWDRELFTIYKFRTMVDNAEKNTGPVLAQENDARITGFGWIIRRLRLDELPQLFNILKGDMSFVGPRPERPFFVHLFEKNIKSYNARFRVKPGLTGLAQINGEYYTDPEIKLKYDLAYIYNQNIFLDILILTETAKMIFTFQQRQIR